MITAKPRLYYSTGIGPNDVLDNTNLLNNKTYRDFDDHIGLQDFFLTSFKLKAQWDDVKNADYMKFGNAYYWIQPKMLNENCALIYCQLDPITSLGGTSKLNYRGGRVKRYHPESAVQNNAFANIMDEPIGCSQILVARTVANFSPSNGNSSVNVIASTVKLDDPNVDLSSTTDHAALVFSGDIGVSPSNPDKYTVVIPNPPAPATYTTFYGFDSEARTIGFGLYDADNTTVKKNLQYIRALGLSDAILFSYTVPLGAVSPVVKDANGHITSIGQSYASASGDKGWRIAANDDVRSGFTNFGAAEVFEKLYSLYTSYVIRGRLSGDIKEFKAREIIESNYNVQFDWVADPQYGGTVYCGPTKFYGSNDPLYRLANSAKGLPWKDVPISSTLPSGALWNRNQYAMQQSEIVRGGGRWDWLKNSAGEGIVANASGLWGMAVSGVGQLLNNVSPENFRSYSEIQKMMPANMDPRAYQQAKEKASYLQSYVVAPELSCSPALGLQTFLNNGFDIIKLMPSDADQVRMNNFFARYGYAVPNIPFETWMLSTRNDFNYIEVDDLEVLPSANAYDAGQQIRNAAAAQFAGGVRILHTL